MVYFLTYLSYIMIKRLYKKKKETSDLPKWITIDAPIFFCTSSLSTFWWFIYILLRNTFLRNDCKTNQGAVLTSCTKFLFANRPTRVESKCNLRIKGDLVHKRERKIYRYNIISKFMISDCYMRIWMWIKNCYVAIRVQPKIKGPFAS